MGEPSRVMRVTDRRAPGVGELGGGPRVVDYFVRNPEAESIAVDNSHTILLGYLLEDGLIEQAGPGTGAIWLQIGEGGTPGEGDITLGPMGWRLRARR